MKAKSAAFAAGTRMTAGTRITAWGDTIGEIRHILTVAAITTGTTIATV